jgi:hypothetical protein
MNIIPLTFMPVSGYYFTESIGRRTSSPWIRARDRMGIHTQKGTIE